MEKITSNVDAMEVFASFDVTEKSVKIEIFYPLKMQVHFPLPIIGGNVACDVQLSQNLIVKMANDDWSESIWRVCSIVQKLGEFECISYGWMLINLIPN